MTDTFERHTEYAKGDRVELAPWLDLWLMGARFGTVTDDRGGPYVRVRLDLAALKRGLPRTAIRKVDA